MLTPRKKQNIIKDIRKNEKDTGSTPVQISLTTKQIEELVKHLKKHPKDVHSRRGLLKMVGKRRRLLRYLERTNKTAFDKLKKKLDL